MWTVGGKTSYECAVGVEIGVACGKASTSTGRTPLLTADLQFFYINILGFLLFAVVLSVVHNDAVSRCKVTYIVTDTAIMY